MSQQNENKPKVAIIGLGHIGSAVATNLVRSHRQVIIADRTPEKAVALAQQLGDLAQPAEVTAAIREASIIILAIYFEPILEFLKHYATELNGKIIVDPSNPIASDDHGGFKKTVGAHESAGQILSTHLPAGATLAKALGTLSAASLTLAAFRQQEKNVLFYATDDTGINTWIEDLINDVGFEPVRIGGLDQSIRIEVFGDLHEFGALGKAVTLSGVKEKF